MLEAVNGVGKASREATAIPQEQVTAFIRIARVKEISGLSKSTLLRWIKAKRFPSAVIVDGNSVLWDLAEVLAWRADAFRKRELRENGQ